MRILITKEQLEARVAELAYEITTEYEGLRPVLICVLKGAVLFVADLVRRLPFDLEIEFMAVASYGKSTESSGVVRILKDLETDIEGRHVLIVEDVIDSGLTLAVPYAEPQGPQSGQPRGGHPAQQAQPAHG